MNYKKTILFTFLFTFFFTTLSFASVDTVGIPAINARSAIVIDRTTKSILYGKQENEVRKMASTTKIMTAIVVIENSNLYSTVTVSKKAAAIGGSTLGIKENDKITVCDLLYGLLLKSGNDTAIALAEYVGGSVEGFAEMMNNKANDIGLKNTHFITPHGLDNDSHYTTAYELAILADYALNNQIFYNIVSTKNYNVTINNSPKNISNTNELLGNLLGVYGVKTGFTNGANRCLVTACKRDNLDIICVVLGCDTKNFRTQDSIKLIEFVFKTYDMVNLKTLAQESFNTWKLENINKFNINKAKAYNLELKIKDFNYSYYPVQRQYVNSITTNIDCNFDLNSPIEINSYIGSLYINISEHDVLKFDIVNTNYISKKSCIDYSLEILSNYFKYLTIKI